MIDTQVTADEQAQLIADKVILAERMGVPTHGLHYFLGALLPHLKSGRVNDEPIHAMGSIVLSNGTGGVGFWQLKRCLDTASDLAKQAGIALCVMKMPGKVGALRVFCKELMELGYQDGMAAREQILQLLGEDELLEAEEVRAASGTDD